MWRSGGRKGKANDIKVDRVGNVIAMGFRGAALKECN